MAAPIAPGETLLLINDNGARIAFAHEVDEEGDIIEHASILVIDDDPDVRGFLAEALGDLGHRVEAAESGAAALAAFERVAPDLMLIDFAMPGMNGAELAKEVRSRRPDQPMLFVTGYAESDQLEGALADVPVLRKPFGVAELAVIVRAHLPENGPRPRGLEAAKA